MARLRTRSFLAACAALALPFTFAANAASPAPDVDIPFEKYTLANGLEVILHRDTASPIVAVNVWYHVGSGDEVPGKSGFAHLFEHMMFQGSKHTGTDVHFPILQEIGASAVNGTTNSYRTNYFETVPAHQIETALWLESDRMGFLLELLTEESFRNQVDVVRNERRQRYDNVPYGKARFEVAKMLYPEGHPYRYLTIGLHEDLVNASLEDVKSFFRTWYAPANATLVIAGDFDQADAKVLVEKWFGSLPALPEPARGKVAPVALEATVTREVPDGFAKLEQIQRTWLGPPAFTDETYALEVMAEVLGADSWGRLSKRLVVQEPLCTSVRVGIDDRTLASEIIVAAQLKPGSDRKRVLAIIDEELARIQREPVSDAELRRVIIGTEAAFVWGLHDLARRADQLQHFNHFTADPGFAPMWLGKFRAVTADAVLAVAKTWLAKPYSEVITVPAKPEGAPKVIISRLCPRLLFPMLACAALGACGKSKAPERPDLEHQVPPADATTAPSDAATPATTTAPGPTADGAATVFERARPAARPIAELKLPTADSFTLDNGLRIYHLPPADPATALPTVAMTFELDLGSVTDPPDKLGLASVCSDLYTEGTERLDKVAWSEALADHAVSISSAAGAETSAIVLTSLTSELGPALDLLAELLSGPGMRQADFDRIIADRKAALAQSRGTAAGVAGRLFSALIWGKEHPYGGVQLEAHLAAITLADCKAWVGQLRPDGARLWVAGKVTRDELKQALATRLATWTGKAPATGPIAAAPTPQGILYAVHVPGAVQSMVMVGHPGPQRTAADYEATHLMAQIFGGNFSSRINMNLREAKGYAYGSRGGYGYRRAGSAFSVSASVESSTTALALREIAIEVGTLRTKPATDTELARERDGALLALPARFAEATDTLDELRTLLFFGLPLDWFAGYQARLKAVDTEAMLAAAKAYLVPGDATVLVVGDLTTPAKDGGGKTIRDELQRVADDKIFGAGGLVILDADGNRLPQ